MDLSIIIVSWNVREKLKNNLSALLAATGDFKLEVIVVDNDSKDGSAEMVKAEFPVVKLIVNGKNLGFAAANNQAIRMAQGKFILLLNPDMQVEADTLKKILAWAENNQRATVVGCKLVAADGKIVRQIRRFPQIFDQLMITLKIPHLLPGVIDKYLCSNFDYETAAKVDSIRGAFFLINRANYQKISGSNRPLLDERYFIWFEEVDFCRQVYQLGGEVWYTPDARCIDYVGQSFKLVPLGESQRYFSESMLKYFKKGENIWEYRILKVAWSLVAVFIK